MPPSTFSYRTLTPLFLATLLYLAGAFSPSHAADINIACASNFQATLQKLADNFAHSQRHHIRISSGSTGKLFTQIQHGAPFDIFLSADREHPAQLHKQGLADAPITYAIGRLVLYAPSSDPEVQLERGDFHHLAIANPQAAPYGTAAQAVLENLQLWDSLQTRLVIGENIGQAFQFVHTGNAELGFVALAQVRALSVSPEHYWEIPSEQYPSLEQQAVVLRRSHTPEAARHFLEYLQSTTARKIIEEDGYGVP